MSLKWDSELDELRIRRRTEILDEARELFLEKGLPRVTMRDISKEVGVSTVTLYKYYKSVDEIAAEVKRQILIEMKQFFNEISTDSTA
ncbi:helix-turn-helix domain containing protein, partial [Escherichia coli]|nr:helix-turn-helix domain containing protein [Escherichia coli]